MAPDYNAKHKTICIIVHLFYLKTIHFPNLILLFYSIPQVMISHILTVFVNLAGYFQEKGYQVTMVTQYQFPAAEEYALPPGVRRVLSDLTEAELSNSRIIYLGLIKSGFREFGKITARF